MSNTTTINEAPTTTFGHLSFSYDAKYFEFVEPLLQDLVNKDENLKVVGSGMGGGERDWDVEVDEDHIQNLIGFAKQVKTILNEHDAVVKDYDGEYKFYVVVETQYVF